jgi:hypothetical protein
VSRRGKIVILTILAVLLIAWGAIRWLDAAGSVIWNGAYCDNCTPDDFARIYRRLNQWTWQFPLALFVLIAAGFWWRARDYAMNRERSVAFLLIAAMIVTLYVASFSIVAMIGFGILDIVGMIVAIAIASGVGAMLLRGLWRWAKAA